jgi:phosphatidylinositol 4-kinase
VAIHLRSRFVNSLGVIDSEILEHSRYFEIKAASSPDAVSFLLKNSWKQRQDEQLRYLLYWAPVPTISATNILGSQINTLQPWILQYSIRALEYFPIEQAFFYIPQLVQALRQDNFGYIKQFILNAAKTSQRFAHQIIWNMNANMFKDEACSEPDPIKPVLDSVVNTIIASLTGPDKAFYQREFGFFEQITGISGKLKPLVHADASKADKKVKYINIRGKLTKKL